jgi:hypothetical protein
MVSEQDLGIETSAESSHHEKSNNNSNKPNNKNNSDMDSSNPYYIHPSDHPGHLLVPTKLNGTNYPSWSRSMIHALTAKNKVGFINGSIKEPSQENQPAEYALWNRCNSMILSWLTHSVEQDLAKGVIHAKTAHQVWKDFKDQFSQKNIIILVLIIKINRKFFSKLLQIQMSPLDRIKSIVKRKKLLESVTDPSLPRFSRIYYTILYLLD